MTAFSVGEVFPYDEIKVMGQKRNSKHILLHSASHRQDHTFRGADKDSDRLGGEDQVSCR